MVSRVARRLIRGLYLERMRSSRQRPKSANGTLEILLSTPKHVGAMCGNTSPTYTVL